MTNQSERQWVIVGLGNPGKKYELTRHNMGYLVTEGFADVHKLAWKEDKKLLARFAKGDVQGTTVHLIQPLTYMNESGQAVRKYVDYYKLTPNDVIVVTDDIALPFGELRLRSQGSAGGHNGLKSIERHLGTNQYARLRVGIGLDKDYQVDLRDYVLDPFSRAEMLELTKVLNKGVSVIEQLLQTPIGDVMSVVNVRLKDKEN